MTEESKAYLYRVFVTVNIVIAWVVGGRLMYDSEMFSFYKVNDTHAVKSLKMDQSKGKRNTYCDHLRHLVNDHGYPEIIIYECMNKPLTDLQTTLSL